MVRGVLSGWAACRHACLDQTPRETLTLKAGQYKYTGTTPLNITSFPDPFPLGLHALPLGLLNRACTQAGPMSSLERRVVQHTFTQASLINDSSTALTNYPIPAASCIGPTCEAGLSTDA